MDEQHRILLLEFRNAIYSKTKGKNVTFITGALEREVDKLLGADSTNPDLSQLKSDIRLLPNECFDVQGRLNYINSQLGIYS